MAIVTPRRREIELVKEAAERVAHRTRSKFVWNDPPPASENIVEDQPAAIGEVSADSPIHFK
ncbi:hypothetical protein [Bradyrhizobium sp. Leo170]|uniref:hypothetical protein n=1 Tax=Bradyrhizobium sp. Leo170 TaxID=1571199 RepID=UPI00102E9649|nr:hypothetical protein [Bradyrhizobium sp. Leo170]TAI67080.1 hypothetical protein CWO89_04895 [Bradyrhizobium sp. Leo170]